MGPITMVLGTLAMTFKWFFLLVVMGAIVIGAPVFALDSYLDPGHLVLEQTGLVVANNGMVGIGLSSPKYALHVSGNVSISGSVSYDLISNSTFDIDWSTANIQVVNITQDGTYGITFKVPPTSNANLTLIVKYTATNIGPLTFSALDQSSGNPWVDAIVVEGGLGLGVGNTDRPTSFLGKTSTTDIFNIFYRSVPRQYFVRPVLGFK